MSTDLHKRMLEFNHGHERNELMRRVWAGTPWMVNAFTGPIADEREREMLHWCYDEFGEQAFTIGERPGSWQRGSATVCGWTWFGFASESDMQKFIARWPAPQQDEDAA